MSSDTVTQLRSPEKVLSTIAATARLDGLVVPRRINFYEPRPGEPLSVLSLAWESAADMRPWLRVFEIDPHRPDATTVYGDHGGWSLMLSSPAPVAICFCEVVHPLGCPGDTSALVCTCYTDPATCVIDGDPVITGTPDEVIAHLADHFGAQANHDEAVRLTNHDEPIPYLLVDLDGPTVVLPTSAVTPCDPELAETIAHRHDPAQIVEHVTVDPDLDAGRGDAEIARIGVPVDLTRGTVEGITGGAS